VDGQIKTIPDPDAVGGYRYQRVPRNAQEETLVRYGWVMQGLSLLSHPSSPNEYFTLKQALELFYHDD
jgi:hypothetical protein